jgi:hypothetical protein
MGTGQCGGAFLPRLLSLHGPEYSGFGVWEILGRLVEGFESPEPARRGSRYNEELPQRQCCVAM